MTETYIPELLPEFVDRQGNFPVVVYSSQRVGFVDRAVHLLAKKFGLDSGGVDFVAIPRDVPPNVLGFIALARQSGRQGTTKTLAWEIDVPDPHVKRNEIIWRN